MPRTLRVIILVLSVVFFTGCANVKPFDYQPTADEIKPGPGLLSGEDGEFVIWSLSSTASKAPASRDSTIPK